ncbi:hypothetical protein GPALN_014539 [Globodera pallida]|nr:hypothetical protein GPALN_014539 [Globodera pallida]
MLPSLLALLFTTSLILIHGTEGVSRVNVLLHDASTLHVWVAKVYLCPPAEAGTIEQSEQLIAECKQYSSDLWHDLIEINGKTAGAYTLTWTETTHASLVYVFEPKTVLKEGIRILFIGEEAKLPNLEGSYHFRAPFGWNSDTCGFNRSKDGLYHLFYQHFPHAVQWYTMHWGHAVSKDLITWVHLPIFMIPPNLLHLDFENGHFTGSSINLPNGEFGVFWSQRICYYYMTVGSERTGGSAGVVLLYKNKNKRADQLDRDWEYQGILHEDNRDELRMCECPMFIAMGDPLNANTEWVLSYVSDKGSYYPTVGMDAEGRARMNSLFVGHFDGRKFEHRFEQKMDFVGGSFAYQGFYDQQSGRAYLIGWICDIGWIGDTTGDPNFDGRGGEFVLSENGQYLMVRPLPELASLREKKPHVITKGQEFHLEKGQAELVFEFSWDNGREETFELHLTPTHTNGKKLELRIDNNGIELKRTWVASNKRMVVYNAMPTKIHIFIDLDTVEYFADDGRWSGAIRLPEASQEKRIGTVESLSSKYVHLFVFSLRICLASCIYHTLSLGHCAELYSSYPVTGYFGDLFVGICSTLSQRAFLLNVVTIFLYLIVGMYIWRQPTSSQFRIFRSLAVIVVANIGGYVFESIMRLFVLQNLQLSNQLFCKDYRAAYLKELDF